MTNSTRTTMKRQTATTTRAILFKLVLLLLIAACSLVSAVPNAPNDASAVVRVRAEQPQESTFSRDQQTNDMQRQQQQHRQLSFNIGFLTFLADVIQSVKHGCPPIGPAHHKCMKNKTSDTSYSANGDNGGDSSYSANSSNQNSQNTSSNNGEIPIGARSLPMWMLIAAAVATALAVGAVVKGLRRSEPPAHALKGSVARRMGLFSQFADCALCDAARPDRTVEMTMSYDDYEKMQPPSSAMV